MARREIAFTCSRLGFFSFSIWTFLFDLLTNRLTPGPPQRLDTPSLKRAGFHLALLAGALLERFSQLCQPHVWPRHHHPHHGLEIFEHTLNRAFIKMRAV